MISQRQRKRRSRLRRKRMYWKMVSIRQILKQTAACFMSVKHAKGKGTLTVKDGEMTIHISLTSKNIVNLYPGLAEDAQKEGAELLEPTVDTVTYDDGLSEEVYGYDVPVPELEKEFDLALIGTKGKWYDHKVSVANPEKTE